MSWTGIGAQTPPYSIDPSSTNGVMGSYTVYPLNAVIQVVHPATGSESLARQQSEGGYVALDANATTNSSMPVTSLDIQPLSIFGTTASSLFNSTPQFVLTWSSSKIRVWKDAARTIPVISGQTTFPIDQASRVYLQGMEKSSQAMDVEIDEQLVMDTQSVQAAAVRLTVVQAAFPITAEAFIPYQWVDVPANWLPGWVPGSSLVSGQVAAGDARGFDPTLNTQSSYRMREDILVTPYPDLYGNTLQPAAGGQAGTSSQYKKSVSVPVADQSATHGDSFINGATPVQTAPGRIRGQADTVTAQSIDSKHITITATMACEEGILAPLALPIDWSYNYAFDISDPANPKINVTGFRTIFPAFETYVKNSTGGSTVILQSTPDSSATVLSLIHNTTVTIPQPIIVP